MDGRTHASFVISSVASQQNIAVSQNSEGYIICPCDFENEHFSQWAPIVSVYE